MRVVLTGASGFLGRQLLERLGREVCVDALARRSPAECGARPGPNVRWFQVDLTDRLELERTFADVARGPGPFVVVHLAAYYDFSGRDRPEYRSVNVVATEDVLRLAAAAHAAGFVLASSVAACQFPRSGERLTESSPADGTTPYARSKRRAEESVRRWSESVRACTVRFAALFSDWCEYEPLFRFLEAWLSHARARRVLAGRGESAVPYLHVREAADFLVRLLARPDRLPAGATLLASSDGAVSHAQLFEAATAAAGRRLRPLHLPRWLCPAVLRVRDALGRSIGSRPFERPWMAAMVDRQLAVDAGATRAWLEWEPRPRLEILRRLPFLVDNRRSFPAEWQRRNHAAIKGGGRHENLRIHRLLEAHEASISEALHGVLLDPQHQTRFPGFQRSAARGGIAALHEVLPALIATVRTREQGLFRMACRRLAEESRAQGGAIDELCAALDLLNEICLLALAGESDAPAWRQALYDHISMTVQVGVDEALDAWEEGGEGAGADARGS